jgi:hypothetical protein
MTTGITSQPSMKSTHSPFHMPESGNRERLQQPKLFNMLNVNLLVDRTASHELLNRLFRFWPSKELLHTLKM